MVLEKCWDLQYSIQYLVWLHTTQYLHINSVNLYGTQRKSIEIFKKKQDQQASVNSETHKKQYQQVKRKTFIKITHLNV